MAPKEQWISIGITLQTDPRPGVDIETCKTDLRAIQEVLRSVRVQIEDLFPGLKIPEEALETPLNAPNFLYINATYTPPSILTGDELEKLLQRISDTLKNEIKENDLAKLKGVQSLISQASFCSGGATLIDHW